MYKYREKWEIDRDNRNDILDNVISDLFIMNQSERLWKKFDDNGCMYLQITEDRRLYRRGDKMYLIDLNNKESSIFDINGNPILHNNDDWGDIYCHKCDGEVDEDYTEWQESIIVDHYLSDKPLSELFNEKSYN
jgi:hypothetical protein